MIFQPEQVLNSMLKYLLTIVLILGGLLSITAMPQVGITEEEGITEKAPSKVCHLAQEGRCEGCGNPLPIVLPSV